MYKVNKKPPASSGRPKNLRMVPEVGLEPISKVSPDSSKYIRAKPCSAGRPRPDPPK